MHSSNESYVHLNDNGQTTRDERVPWFWKLIALAASFMILGGYLILPGLYAKDPQLNFSPAVLSVFVVALLTAGYSFTALLCFACRNETFQAEGVFLPALTSSAMGLATIAYNFLASSAYVFDRAAISGTVVSSCGTLLYGALLLWSHRRSARNEQADSRSHLWSEQSYYSNYVVNQYPTACSLSRPVEPVISDDERVNQQMALLLVKSDARPSPDANSTFRIHLPGDTEQQRSELVGAPAQTHAEWNRERADSRPDSLSEDQAWQQWQDRGRTSDRTSGRSSNHSRNLSREERRREIELSPMNF